MINEWKKLFELMITIKEIAPWEWLYEQDIFAVQNPETNEIGFVSVMGAIGEHYALSVYLGEKALYKFWDLQKSASGLFSHQEFFEIPQLQASFEDRNFLHSKDRDLIKKTGLKFQGLQSWPMFRSYRPGFFPWYLELDEVFFLQCVLEQTIEVSLRVKQDYFLLKPDDDKNYLLRKPVKKENKLLWQNSNLKVSSPPLYQIDISINKRTIEILKRITPSNTTLEIDLFMLTKPVKEKGMRPLFPYSLMMLDANNGMIVNNQLLLPVPTLEAMWGTIPSQIAEHLAKMRLLPEKIIVSSELIYQVLIKLCYNLGISLQRIEVLPNISQARESMLEFFKQQNK